MRFFGTYRVLLSQREASWLAVSAVTTRVPTPLLSLGFLITIQERTGSYAGAGLLWTAYSVAYAIAVPITSQLVDRKGPRLVLLRCLAGYVPAFALMLTALFVRAPVPVLIPAAALLGACTPPAGPLIRGSWPAVVPSDRLQSAFALDAVITEATLIGAPLLVSALIAFAAPLVAVVLGGLSMVGGTALLVASPSIKKREVNDDGPRRRGLQVLNYPGLRVLFAIVFFDILAYGCLVVGITALATYQHARSASGVLLSMVSVGVVAGGLIYGSREWPGSARRQLSFLYAAGALILVIAVAVNPGLIVLGAMFVVAGVIGGPRDTLLQLVLGKTAPPEYRTVAFAWLSTITWASYGLGTALGGQLVGLRHGSGGLAILVTALVDGCAAAVALAVRPVPSGAAGAAPGPPAAVSAAPETKSEG